MKKVYQLECDNGCVGCFDKTTTMMNCLKEVDCQSCTAQIEQETAQKIFDVLNSTCMHRQNGQMAKECYHCVRELKSKYGVK